MRKPWCFSCVPVSPRRHSRVFAENGGKIVAVSESAEIRNARNGESPVKSQINFCLPDAPLVQNQPETDGVAFYRVEESKEPTINSYRAYLTVPAEAGINYLVLQLPDDNVTGIETAMEADNEVDVYSISGVLIRSKVKKSEALNGLDKGIYIVNGIKQAVK